jgi:hypothetical protein
MTDCPVILASCRVQVKLTSDPATQQEEEEEEEEEEAAAAVGRDMLTVRRVGAPRADLAPQRPSRNKRAWPASPEPQTSWPPARPEESIWKLWSPATPIAGGYLTDAWHKYDSIRLPYPSQPRGSLAPNCQS